MAGCASPELDVGGGAARGRGKDQRGDLPGLGRPRRLGEGFGGFVVLEGRADGAHRQADQVTGT